MQKAVIIGGIFLVLIMLSGCLESPDTFYINKSDVNGLTNPLRADLNANSKNILDANAVYSAWFCLDNNCISAWSDISGGSTDLTLYLLKTDFNTYFYRTWTLSFDGNFNERFKAAFDSNFPSAFDSNFGAQNLGDLNNVNAFAPALNNVLCWDGNNWEACSLTFTDTNVWTAQFLRSDNNNLVADWNAHQSIYAENLNYNEGMLYDVNASDVAGNFISVPTSEVLIRANANWEGYPLFRFVVPANTSLAVDNNAVNYVYVDYNNGSPVYKSSTNRDIINNSNIIPVMRVYIENGNIDYQTSYGFVGRSATIRNFDRVMRIRGSGGIERESGFSMSELPNRVIRMASGYVWFGVDRRTLGGIDQNGAGVVSHLWYHSGGSWVDADINQYNNTQYDDGTNLQTLTTNRYAVNWVYRNITTSEIDIVLGTGDYTSSQAEASMIPSLPTQITNFYLLVGRIIVQKNNSTAYAIENVANVSFRVATTTNHADLSNLTWSTAGHTIDANFNMNGYDINAHCITFADKNIVCGTWDIKSDLLNKADFNTYGDLRYALKTDLNLYLLIVDANANYAKFSDLNLYLLITDANNNYVKFIDLNLYLLIEDANKYYVKKSDFNDLFNQLTWANADWNAVYKSSSTGTSDHNALNYLNWSGSKHYFDANGTLDFNGSYFWNIQDINIYGNFIADGNVGIGTKNTYKRLVVQDEMDLNGSIYKDGNIFLWDSEVNKNLFLGRSAGLSIGSGIENVGIGQEAMMYYNSSSAACLGYQCLKYATNSNKACVGYQCMKNSQAVNGTCVGYLCLRDDNGLGNTAFGYQSGLTLRYGQQNTLIGNGAGSILQDGSENVAIGSSALPGDGNGIRNTMIGSGAGQGLNDGNSNIFIGYLSGLTAAGTYNGKFVLDMKTVPSPFLEGDMSLTAGPNFNRTQLLKINANARISNDLNLQFGLALPYTIRYAQIENKLIIDSNSATAGDVIIQAKNDATTLRTRGGSMTWSRLYSGTMSMHSCDDPPLTAPTSFFFTNNPVPAPTPGVYSMAFNQDADNHLCNQEDMQQDYNEGSDWYPFIDWSPPDTLVCNVVWELEYTVAPVGTAFPMTTTSSITVATAGVAFQHQRDYFTPINGRAEKIDSVIIYRISRDADNIADNCPTPLWAHGIGFQYENDTDGSTRRIVK